MSGRRKKAVAAAAKGAPPARRRVDTSKFYVGRVSRPRTSSAAGQLIASFIGGLVGSALTGERPTVLDPSDEALLARLEERKVSESRGDLVVIDIPDLDRLLALLREKIGRAMKPEDSSIAQALHGPRPRPRNG